MRRWKRVLLGLCLPVAAAVALILWDCRAGRTPGLSFAFVGYTNRAVDRYPLSWFAANTSSVAIAAAIQVTNALTLNVRLDRLMNNPHAKYAVATQPDLIMAVMRVTNSGPVTLRIAYLANSLQPANSSGMQLWALAYPPDGSWQPVRMPQILKPGEWFTFEVKVPEPFYSWSADAYFTAWGPYERAYTRALTSGNSSTRQWMLRHLPNVKATNLKLGPITNQPPATGGASRITDGR